MSTYDPVSTATQLASAYTYGLQSLITTQTKTAQTTSSALTKLQTALQNFESTLSTLSGKKSLMQYSATFSNTAYGTATASASAEPGSYPLFVEQIASAHQVMFTDLPAIPMPMTGPLKITTAGGTFEVDFTTADADSDGTLSQTEMARAINQAGDNQGKVAASVVTAGGQVQLVLTAGETGASSQITLDASGLAGGAEVDTLKAKLAAGTELVPAQDAIVYLGPQGTGAMMQQASNVFTGITGVSMTFTKAMAAGDPPITLTVANDSSGTAANVQSFVDAYNTLKKTLDELTKVGDPDSGTASAAFASDAGVRSLRGRLAGMLRESFGGVSLMEFGVTADRQGTLSLNTAKLQEKVAAQPDALDSLFGSASLTSSSGLLGGLDTYLDGWTNSVSGQIKRRQESVQSMQAAITRRQQRLDQQYESAYQRYLVQFTTLQGLEAQMSRTGSIFDSLSVSPNE
jgi:flagellar hook-associated protein 2